MRYVNGRLRWGFDEWFQAVWGVIMTTFGIAWLFGRVLIVVAAGRIMGWW